MFIYDKREIYALVYLNVSTTSFKCLSSEIQWKSCFSETQHSLSLSSITTFFFVDGTVRDTDVNQIRTGCTHAS